MWMHERRCDNLCVFVCLFNSNHRDSAETVALWGHCVYFMILNLTLSSQSLDECAVRRHEASPPFVMSLVSANQRALRLVFIGRFSPADCTIKCSWMCKGCGQCSGWTQVILKHFNQTRKSACHQPSCTSLGGFTHLWLWSEGNTGAPGKNDYTRTESDN